MPDYEPNLLLNAPGFSEAVMRALGIKGNLPRELLPLFGAQFTLDDFSKPEYLWARRASTWEMGIIAPAVAGQLSRVVLTSRVAAGTQRSTLCVVDQLIISTPTAGGTGLQIGIDLLGSGIADPTVSARFRDDRIFGKSESVFSMSGGAAVANPITGRDHMTFILAQNVPLFLSGFWALSNVDNGVFRSCLMVIGTTGNVDLRVSATWKERDLLPEEV